MKKDHKKSGHAVPQEHYEVHHRCPVGSDTGAGAFLPRPGKSRPSPHVKINETDH